MMRKATIRVAGAAAFPAYAPLSGKGNSMAIHIPKDDDFWQQIRDEHPNDELFQAIEDNDPGRVAKCLAGGANANTRDCRDQTPLFWAVSMYKNLRISELLLNHGADVNARGYTDQTPLHTAARYGQVPHLRVLLGAGAEIDARDERGRTPLFGAAIPPRMKALTFLVSQGADVSIRDARGHTPLSALGVIRGDNASSKNPLLVLPGELADDQWKTLRGLLGGFTAVKVLDTWRDSVIIRVEGQHWRFTAAERQAKERDGLTVPTNLVFGRDVPQPGQRLRCGKELSPALEEAWNELRQRRDPGIELMR